MAWFDVIHRSPARDTAGRRDLAISTRPARVPRGLLSAGLLGALLGGCAGEPAPLETPGSSDVLSAQEALVAGDITGLEHAWETIPSVVRSDGSEEFVLEVDPVDGVVSVELTGLAFHIEGPSDLTLRDDGVGADRVAGDGIFSVGPFRVDPTPSFPLPAHYESSADSPAGLYALELGDLVMTKATGETVAFFIRPQVGALDPSIPAAPRRILSPKYRAASHLVEVRNARADSQRLLRGAGDNVAALLTDMYEVVPDVFDFAVLSATSHIERPGAVSNGNAGVHSAVKIDYSGIGRDPVDYSESYYSRRLKGVAALDNLRRGWLSNNFVHELLHQWSAFLPFDLGMTDGAHYLPTTSAASLLGGMEWIDNGNGTFTLDCDSNGRGGASTASPFDLYMMGLIPGSMVPPLRRHGGGLFDYCDAVIPSVQATVTIEQIQARLGVRTPGPATAQRDFHIAFIVEAHGRDLTDSELTFFNTLAEFATRPVPAGQPNPMLSSNWVPITRYFGNGTTWRTDIPDIPANPGAVTASINVNSSWPTGYCANVTVTNGRRFDIWGWEVVIDLQQSTVNSSWSANFSFAGSEMTATNTSSNGMLDAGASTSFGFCANKTGAAWQPQVVSASHQ
ncbi:cellulose binding domain-containing protein [Sorangium sp. So ce1078]|uniref:cellulose binding domain-containing protein n=1 Tax=Sorangium sp. So ce1078 TaxID=3133329 RepID=UPI003F63E3E9